MLVGFGTKHLLDRVVRPFVQKEGGKFWEPFLPEGRHVGQFDQTIWPDFNMDDFLKEKSDVAVFGILRGTENWLWKCKQLGLNYYYFDHAYFFKANKHRPNDISKLLSYRITKNSENLTKIVDLDDEDKDRILKYKKFSETLRLKKIPKGDHILIIPPTEAVCRYYKIHSLESWEKQVKEKVRQWSDRDFIVRPKTMDNPLEQDLQKAHCVITYQSTVGITAILKGIPVICDDVSMCKPISIKYEDIEKPHIINEDLTNKWIDSLLANQFTMQEIENGTAKKIVEKYD
jgi:hypothetical protein